MSSVPFVLLILFLFTIGAAPAKAAPAPTPPTEVGASTTGDPDGNGRQLAIEVRQFKDFDVNTHDPILTLIVREPGDPLKARTLARMEFQGSSADKVQLADFDGSGKPFIVVTGAWRAPADFSGIAQVFSLSSGNLQKIGRFTAYLGSFELLTMNKAPVIRAKAFERLAVGNDGEEYLGLDPAAPPYYIRTELIGWKDGKLQAISSTPSRRIYSLDDSPDEKPLPAEAVEHYKQGKKLIARRPGEAVKFLEKAVSMAPDFTDAWDTLSLAYAKRKMWDKSFDAADKAVQLNKYHAYAQFNRGVAALELGKLDIAVESFTISTGLQAKRWEPHYWLGQAHERRGNADAAKFEYEAALKIKPGQQEVKDAMARVTKGGRN